MRALPGSAPWTIWEATWLHLWLGEIEYQDRHFDAALVCLCGRRRRWSAPCGLDDDQERIRPLAVGADFGETSHSTCLVKTTSNEAPRSIESSPSAGGGERQ